MNAKKKGLTRRGLLKQSAAAVAAGASGLLAIVFGAAVGNLVRGFPLDANGEFFLPFFTDFDVSGEPGIFDWYTLLAAVLALVALLQHGALWIAYRTHEPLETRARIAAFVDKN